jgi:hypothetical protein
MVILSTTDLKKLSPVNHRFFLAGAGGICYTDYI